MRLRSEQARRSPMSDDKSSTQPLGVSRFARLDAVCDRFERAWLSQSPPIISELLDEVPAPHRPLLLRELLLVELHHRHTRGDTVEHDASGRFSATSTPSPPSCRSPLQAVWQQPCLLLETVARSLLRPHRAFQRQRRSSAITDCSASWAGAGWGWCTRRDSFALSTGWSPSR